MQTATTPTSTPERLPLFVYQLILWLGLSVLFSIALTGFSLAAYLSPVFLTALTGLSIPLMLVFLVTQMITRLRIFQIPALLLMAFIIGVSFYYLPLIREAFLIAASTLLSFALIWFIAALQPVTFERLRRVLAVLSLILIWSGTGFVLSQAPVGLCVIWLMATIICLTILLYESCCPIWQQQMLDLRTFSGIALLLCGLAFQIGLLLKIIQPLI